MKKKLLLTTSLIIYFFVGCGKVTQNNTMKQNEQLPIVVTATSDKIDYSQYAKKKWLMKDETKSDFKKVVYFSISQIQNEKIIGKLSTISFIPTNENLLSFESGFNGVINKGTAECQFSDSSGNKGNIKLVFKDNNKIEAVITIIDKSKTTIQPTEGTFEFVADNIKNKEGFSPIENQCFEVDLNSWGDVKFVSGKIKGGDQVPLVFYLTNKDGDILYDFNATLPYSVDVKAVSFEDLNKDGIKDIIIIVSDSLNATSDKIATVYFQKLDGTFVNQPKLDQEINSSGSKKDIRTVKNYISQSTEKYTINSIQKSSENNSANTPERKYESKVLDNEVYSNAKFGFTLTFPESWKGKCFITEDDYGITVNYNTEVGKKKGITFFGINRTEKTEWIENSGAPVEKICEKNGFVYYANFPTQVAFDMGLDNEKREAEDYIEKNKDTKNIIKSLKVIN